MEDWQLKQLVSLAPNLKLQRTERKIYDFLGGVGWQAYVAWSGGLDSRVMLDVIRRMGIGPNRVPAVFINTGLEYPEVLEVALRHANVVLRPEMSFGQVVKKYGYPVIGKKAAQHISEVRSAYRKGNRDSATVRLRMTGITTAGKHSPLGKISEKWKHLCEAPFEVSPKCCDVLKKGPAKAYEESTGKHPMIGMRVCDSNNRERAFLHNRQGSCNSFGERPSSWPLAIWTDEDIWWYIRKFNLDYPSLYDHGATGTGCYACMFGIHMEKGENRFQRMFTTHPKHWRQCMDGFGCRKVMEYIGLPIEPQEKQQELSI
jgi:3'-phosphoadenosine 5'-phosphosulfate sulfotransferase (PAPS reductase)/FAD synthetase